MMNPYAFLIQKFCFINISLLLFYSSLYQCIRAGRNGLFLRFLARPVFLKVKIKFHFLQKASNKERLTVKRGIPPRNSGCVFVFENFIAIIYSKRRFGYASVYRWPVNTLWPTKSSLNGAFG